MKFEDNLSPYTSYVESSAPSSPSAGNQRIYIDSADHHLKRKNSGGTATDIEGAAAFVGVRAYNDADINVPLSTTTVVTLNQERYDTDAFHSTSSNTSRLTVPSGKGGYYQIFGSVRVAMGAIDKQFIAWIKLNGTTFIGGESGEASVAGETVWKNVSVPYSLSVGDYVELYVQNTDAGNAYTVQSAANYSPEFGMYLIGT